MELAFSFRICTGAGLALELALELALCWELVLAWDVAVALEPDGP